VLAEVLKSIRVYVNLVLIASLGWLVSASNFEHTLERREQVKKLAAYLLLRDTFVNLKDTNLFPADKGPTSEVERVTQIKTAGHEPGVGMPPKVHPVYPIHQTIRLVAQSPWSDHATDDLTVTALDKGGITATAGRLLSISAKSSTLPFSDYLVCNCLPPKRPDGSDEPNSEDHERVQILRKDAELEMVAAGDEELGTHTDFIGGKPYGWESIAPFLVAHGWTGNNPETLSSLDVSVISAVNDYIFENNVRQEVAGISFPMVFLPIGIGGFLILISALQWGNIVALRRARRARQFEETAWVVLPFGVDRWELRVSMFFAVVISCIAIALPSSAAFSAGWLIVKEQSYGKPALCFLCCALLMALGMLGLIVLEQFRLWHESRKS
jgi:hypothetical protein